MGEVDEVERLRREYEELLEALELLEQARDGYAELFELAPLAMFVVLPFPRFSVQAVNVAAAELLGRDRTDLHGLPFTELIHMGDRQLVASCLQRDRSKLNQAAPRLLRRDGEVRVRLVAVASKTEPSQLHITATPIATIA